MINTMSEIACEVYWLSRRIYKLNSARTINYSGVDDKGKHVKRIYLFKESNVSNYIHIT